MIYAKLFFGVILLILILYSRILTVLGKESKYDFVGRFLNFVLTPIFKYILNPFFLIIRKTLKPVQTKFGYTDDSMDLIITISIVALIIFL